MMSRQAIILPSASRFVVDAVGRDNSRVGDIDEPTGSASFIKDVQARGISDADQPAGRELPQDTAEVGNGNHWWIGGMWLRSIGHALVLPVATSGRPTASLGGQLQLLRRYASPRMWPYPCGR